MRLMRTERFSHIYFIVLFLLVLLNSCEEKPEVIGVGLIPSGDALSVSFDSLGTIRGYTVYGDSVLGMSKTNYILGSQVDDYFGFSKAEIISQIQPSITGSFGSNPHADSVILSLRIASIKGIPTAPVMVTVYEYTEMINRDSAYWSNMDITGKYRDQVIGTARLLANDTLIKVLITDTVFINKFLQAPDSVLGSIPYLQEYVNGLYITTEDAVSGGVLVSMDWQTGLHKLTFHYENDSISSSDTMSALTLDFLIGTSSMGINLFQHDYKGYPIEPYVNSGSVDDSLLFVQSLAGVSPIIKLTGITDWIDSMPVAIIDAKLIIPVVDRSHPGQKESYLPSNLGLFIIDNEYRFSYDYILDWESAGGDYDKSSNSYIFNLKVQIQSIMAGRRTLPGEFDWKSHIRLCKCAVSLDMLEIRMCTPF